jgi:hypothetical protein
VKLFISKMGSFWYDGTYSTSYVMESEQRYFSCTENVNYTNKVTVEADRQRNGCWVKMTWLQ